ncbi:GalNAc-alpha-(1-_4)-GalNAc-alpha-(1-_3)-diNAcBac-PP-undecaprenol alpha-1,4-N-acetyl-D-galactosaminyltransferase [Aquisphaera giovannonii]|uniref:GalNAc-alpha-(1->4)-GalNAc-alpha-(1->3)-diNAcBac-PP-undecaprenol alpha-1,4-N-acetyl-D-galactosaminyltransferase n=1 Tax=Aquisphaera giovannonii TaxID=406548 RepID=A0A5B9VV49_9BACT|nr:GalNAc-alpha-(1->4)-GalNAc-alpha-(1->3)-diNAcBac-PP-undecaprenol alpha-1,4-N-acetyl-D-galactosaminyltransferase [Aquisphaera giovannonii]
MLKVLQLIPTLDRSGAEKQMVLLARGLPRDRFSVEVATLTRGGPLAGELGEAGIPVTDIGKRWKVDPLALGRLTRHMKARRFDVVQTWIFAANAYGRIAARRAGVPVVVTSEMAVDLWKGKVEKAVDRRLATWCDRLVGNSRAVVGYYRGLGVPDDRLAMIYSGIAIEEPPAHAGDPAATRAEFGIAADAPLVLFAGRLAEQKRVDDLLKAVDLLQHVQPDLRTILVGDGPLRGPLEATARAYDLAGKAFFLGHRDDVPRLMAAADLVVLPSSYEGLPNVVLEAMLHRKPVVATAAPGTTEVVADGETGVLVPIGDPPLLARAIRDLVRDPARRRRLGEAGRARVESHFRAEAMVDAFARLYEGLARRKRD